MRNRTVTSLDTSPLLRRRHPSASKEILSLRVPSNRASQERGSGIIRRWVPKAGPCRHEVVASGRCYGETGLPTRIHSQKDMITTNAARGLVIPERFQPSASGLECRFPQKGQRGRPRFVPEFVEIARTGPPCAFQVEFAEFALRHAFVQGIPQVDEIAPREIQRSCLFSQAVQRNTPRRSSGGAIGSLPG